MIVKKSKSRVSTDTESFNKEKEKASRVFSMSKEREVNDEENLSTLYHINDILELIY